MLEFLKAFALYNLILVSITCMFIAVGQAYILKLLFLSKAWAKVWLSVFISMLLLPVSRMVLYLISCPTTESFYEYVLVIICPLLGSGLFAFGMKKLYKIFSKYLKEEV